MIWLFTTLYMMLGAAAWMFRGGAFWNTGSTQFARLAGATAITLPLVFFTLNWWLLMLIVTIWAGVASTGWGDFFDMGTNHPDTAKSEELVSFLLTWISPTNIWHDILGMSLSGVVVMAPSMVLLFVLGFSWYWLLVPALFLGPIYWVSWQITQTQAISTAEGITGAVICWAMCAALGLWW
jgi:hypothetical protein